MDAVLNLISTTVPGSPVSSPLPELPTIKNTRKQVLEKNVTSQLKKLRYKLEYVFYIDGKPKFIKAYTFLGENVIIDIEDFLVDHTSKDILNLENGGIPPHNSYRDSIKVGVKGRIYGIAVITYGDLSIFTQSSDGYLKTNNYKIKEISNDKLQAFPFLKLSEIQVHNDKIIEVIKDTYFLIQNIEQLNNRRILVELVEEFDKLRVQIEGVKINADSRNNIIKTDFLKLRDFAYKITEDDEKSERVSANLKLRQTAFAETMNIINELRDCIIIIKELFHKISLINEKLLRISAYEDVLV